MSLVTISQHKKYSGHLNISGLIKDPKACAVFDSDATQMYVRRISADLFDPEDCNAVLKQVVAEWMGWIEDNFESVDEFVNSDNTAPDDMIGTLTMFIGDDNVYLGV